MESLRSTPVLPVAAAVVSEERVAPRKVPCCQLNDSYTSGTTCCRLAPNSIALIGTPFGSCQCGEIAGHCTAGAVKRLFGCAAFSPESGDQGLPRQSRTPSPGGSSCPSHHTVPSRRSATLV